MVPAVSLAFPAVVVVVTGASRRPHIRNNQNLGLMLHNTCVPISTLCIAGQSGWFLHIRPRVLVACFES